MRLNLVVACLALLPFKALASPPPPPPEYIANAARILSENLTPQTFDAYSDVFADDLQIFIDGRIVASGRRSWLSLERARLGKVERHLIGFAEGPDNVLIVDEFDDTSGLPVRPGLLFDRRVITRAARYQFGQDHLIHEARFVQGGGFWVSIRRGH